MRILFVCSGNTCRSPMAESLMKDEIRRKCNTRCIEVLSAGLSAFPGAPISDKAARVLMEENLDPLPDHRATVVNQELVDSMDLILVMTAEHKRQLLSRDSNAAEKIHLLKKYADPFVQDDNISDPFGGNLEKYRATLKELRTSIKKLANKLDR